MIFYAETVKTCKEKRKKYKLDAEDCDRWGSIESIVKNEESKDSFYYLTWTNAHFSCMWCIEYRWDVFATESKM